MQMYLKTLSVVVASLLIVGCSVKIQPYYSEANESYTSSSIQTNLSGIAGDDDNLSYPAGFGVINAIDNDEVHYTLMVPTYDEKGAYGSPVLSLYNFHHAAFLTEETLTELIEAVDNSIEDWTTVYSPNKARNISYLSGSKKSSVDFHYQNGAAGEVAFIDIDSGEEFNTLNDDDSITVAIKVYHFEIRSLAELKGFSYLLHKAQEENSPKVVVEIENNTTIVEINATISDSNITVPMIEEDLNVTTTQEDNASVAIESVESNTTSTVSPVEETPSIESNSSVTP